VVSYFEYGNEPLGSIKLGGGGYFCFSEQPLAFQDELFCTELQLLSFFAYLRKSTISFVRYVCLSLHQSASLLTHVRKSLGSDLEWDWYSCDMRSVFRHLQVKFILRPPTVLCFVEWYHRPMQPKA